MRSLIRTIIIAVVGCVLIVMATPLIRRTCVILQLERATEEISAGAYKAAEARLDRYEEWAIFFPNIHGGLLCEIIRCKVRQKKIEQARRCAESMHQCHPPTLDDAMDPTCASIRNVPDWVINKAYTAISGNSQAWDPDIGRQVLLDELWKMEAYDELVDTAKKILAADPEDRAAKSKLALVQNRETAATVVERPGAATPRPPRRPSPRPVPPPGPPAVTIVKPEVAAPEPAGTFEEVATAEDPRELRQKELKDREAELASRLQARRKTLTNSRPVTEAERARDTVQHRYDELTTRAKALESEANNSTGQKRISALEQLRSMKGQMMRCQGELESAEAAANSASEKRKAAIENDPEIKSLEKDLNAVRSELKSL